MTADSKRIREALHQRERRAAAKGRNRWGDGLEGQRVPGFRVVVTEQTRHGTANRHTFVVADEPDKTGAEPWQHLTAETTEQLPVSLDLAPGVSVSARALTTILDALCIDGRHNVDIADLAVVISQLGHRLNAIDTIAGPQRQHAERALYNVILSRCTSSM